MVKKSIGKMAAAAAVGVFALGGTAFADTQVNWIGHSGTHTAGSPYTPQNGAGAANGGTGWISTDTRQPTGTYSNLSVWPIDGTGPSAGGSIIKMVPGPNPNEGGAVDFPLYGPGSVFLDSENKATLAYRKFQNFNSATNTVTGFGQIDSTFTANFGWMRPAGGATAEVGFKISGYAPDLQDVYTGASANTQVRAEDEWNYIFVWEPVYQTQAELDDGSEPWTTGTATTGYAVEDWKNEEVTWTKGNFWAQYRTGGFSSDFTFNQSLEDKLTVGTSNLPTAIVNAINAAGSTVTGFEFGIGSGSTRNAYVSHFQSSLLNGNELYNFGPLLGDANLDGTVNGLDLSAMASNFGTSGNVWAGGDFNADGNVNGLDLSILASNWNVANPNVPASSGGVSFDEALAAVGLGGIPEPSSMLLLGAGAMLMLRRRR